MRAGRAALLGGVPALLAAPLWAAELVLGQVAPLDDPASIGNQLRQGIELCLADINRRGGSHGATLRLVSRHRGPDDVVPRTRALLAEAKPVALVGMMGTGPTEALLRSGLLAAAAVPAVGIRSGASTLREGAGTEWLFHTRAGYATEVARVLEHLRTLGATRLGLYHEQSAFGTELRTLVQRRAAEMRFGDVVLQSHAPRAADPGPAIAAFAHAGVNAVLVAGTSEAAAEFHRAYRRAGGGAHVLALSTVDAAQVLRHIGPAAARGLAVVQTVPDPADAAVRFSRELQAVLQRAGPAAPRPTPALAEGCIAARTVAEGLHRAGPNPTGERLRRALESVGELDLGGVVVAYAGERRGSSFIDIAVLDGHGRLRR
jgi:ABC-type branched-subunit amino acid transport system substrate-binding protein